jgi:hypothetical protein
VSRAWNKVRDAPRATQKLPETVDGAPHFRPGAAGKISEHDPRLDEFYQERTHDVHRAQIGQ